MITQEQMILRLVAAAILGSVVGWNRERLEWAPGLRTHMLVCLGACLFMLVSSSGFGDVLGQAHIGLDPSRVAAQVVSGIGFLGAGTIIFRRDVIRGLTTAASLWAVAAVGLATGGGLYLSAAVTTLLVLLILAWLKPLEKRVFQNQRSHSIHLLVERQTSLLAVEAALAASEVGFKRIVLRPGDDPEVQRLEVVLERVPPQQLLRLLDELRSTAGLREVSAAS